MFARLWRRSSRKAGSPNGKPRSRRLLLVERLEERQLLTAVPTLTSLQVSAATLLQGQTKSLTATVAVASPNSGAPTGGKVTFYNGIASLGTAALNSGTATLQVSTLPLGTDVLMANYSGDGANFAGSSTVVGPNSIITTVAGGGSPGDGTEPRPRRFRTLRASQWTRPGTSSSPTTITTGSAR